MLSARSTHDVCLKPSTWKALNPPCVSIGLKSHISLIFCQLKTFEIMGNDYPLALWLTMKKGYVVAPLLPISIRLCGYVSVREKVFASMVHGPLPWLRLIPRLHS